MAGTEGWSRVLHRQDERGVIVESRVFGPDDEVPDDFGPVDYKPVYDVREDDQEPVAESVLTPWESPASLGWVEQPEPEEAIEDIESEVDESETVDESDDGTPREAREQSEDGDLTGAEEEVDEQLAESEVSAPPQGGPGSGREAWSQYAAANGVSVPEDATRDEIIAAVDKAGFPV